MDLLNKIQFAANFINERIGQFKPELAVQLGTGMTSSLENMEIVLTIPYEDIPHFQITTAPSHKGRMIFGLVEGKKIIILDGRYHYYEGYSMSEVAFPVYVLKNLGIRHLLLTNASGSVDPDLNAGSLVNISDHINLHHDNPLRGQNDIRIGPRFPSMGNAYDKFGRHIIKECAHSEGIKISDGIYLGLSGPNFETPAEYRMARILGASIIGMSTIPEVIAANHCQLRVNALSIVSNQYNNENPEEDADLEEVLDVVKKNSKVLLRLLTSVIKTL